MIRWGRGSTSEGDLGCGVGNCGVLQGPTPLKWRCRAWIVRRREGWSRVVKWACETPAVQLGGCAFTAAAGSDGGVLGPESGQRFGEARRVGGGDSGGAARAAPG